MALEFISNSKRSLHVACVAQATHALLFLLQNPGHRVRAVGTHLTGRLKNFSAVAQPYKPYGLLPSP